MGAPPGLSRDWPVSRGPSGQARDGISPLSRLIHNCEYRFLWSPGPCKASGMVKTPCQQIVWDVLPAIRAALAAELVKNGVSRQEVARLLDTAPSAVSQYLSGKRGYRIVFEPPVQKLIEDLARDIKTGRVTDVTSRICAICREVRGDRGPCLVVQEPGSPDPC